MTAKEHLCRHDREIAEIRAIQKRNEQIIENLGKRTDEMASANANEKAEIWVLMGKLAKDTQEARDETRIIRKEIRELAAAQKRREAELLSFIASLRGTNGHRKRNVS